MHRTQLAALTTAALSILVLGCPSPGPGNGDPDAGTDAGTGRRCDQGTYQCLPGEVCNGNTGECFEVPSCDRGDLQCTSAVPSCDPQSPQSCEACTSDSQCSGAFPKCSTSGPTECVQCLADADCPAEAPLCSGGRCGTCTAGSCPAGSACVGGVCRQECGFCEAPTPYCHGAPFGTDYCVECLGAEHCAGALACVRGRCVTPVVGDSCKNPELIGTLTAGTRIVEGRVPSLAGADVDPDHLDMFYAFDVTESGLLEVAVEALSSGGLGTYEASEIFKGDPCDRANVIATGGWYASPLDQVFLTPGRYTHRIFFISGSFAYRLHYTFTPSSGVTGNSCMLPIVAPIGAPGGSSATVEVLREGLTAIDGDPCDGTVDGPDAVVQFTLQETSAVTARVTPRSSSGSVWAELRAACNAEENACGTHQTGTTTLGPQRLEPGTYHLLLHNLTDSLDVELTASKWWPNDSCAEAAPLTFDAQGVARIAADTRYTYGGLSGCGRDPQNALFYSFSTVGLGPRSLRIDKLAGAATTEVALNGSCPGPQYDAQHCWKSSGTYQEFANLPEGNYWLDVTAAEAFELVLTLGPGHPAPGNDYCGSAAGDLTLTNDAFTVNGDTRGATDSETPVCGASSPFRGRDVSYEVYLPRGTLTATVAPADATFSPILWISDLTCDSNVATCAAATAPGESVSASFKSTGLWRSIVVDGQGGTSGAFTLTGAFAPAPADDVCEGAAVIAPGTTLTRSLANYFPDGEFWCDVTAAGPDTFFKLSVTQNRSVSVTVTPAGFDAALFVEYDATNPCSIASCGGKVDAGGAGVAETLTFNATKGTVYVIGVYSPAGTTAGSYTLTVAP